MMRNSLRLLLTRSYTRSSSLSHSHLIGKTSSLSNPHFITKTTPWNRIIASNFSSVPSDDKPNEGFVNVKLRFTLKQFSGTDSSRQHIESEIHRGIQKAIDNREWVHLERKMKQFKVKFTSETVVAGLQLCTPNRAYANFLEIKKRSEIFEIDERVYNVIARMIVQEDYQGFWNLVMEMVRLKFGMEKETFNAGFGYFLDNEMLTSAFDLYRYALHGLVKELESEQCCLLLLDKIISSGEEMDVDLFSKVVMKFINAGNRLSDVLVVSVLESLIKADRLSFFLEKFKEKEEVKIVYGGEPKSVILSILSVIAKNV